MKRTRRRPPYKPDGRTNFPVKAPGVYMIHDGPEPVYIGFGKNVYRALYRHFQRWDDPKQVRVTYPKHGHTVRVVYTTDARKAERLERALILKYKPRDNPNKLSNYTLTDTLKNLANAAENAPFTPTGEPAPF